jgi:hypothetical protein
MVVSASDAEWSMPIVVGADVRENLIRDVDFADAFFLCEAKRLRAIYGRTGNPRLTYMCGRGVAEVGRQLSIRGSVGHAVVEMTLAEMLIAGGASGDDLTRAEAHLLAGRDQLEGCRHVLLLARVLVQWYLLMSVCLKARGRLGDYERILSEGVGETWIARHTKTGDRMPVIRQQVMMRQDLEAHLALLSR